MITALTTKPLSNLGAFNIGGVNASGQVSSPYTACVYDN